jgi:anion-transporting  ArsA/GET3 family ATPase
VLTRAAAAALDQLLTSRQALFVTGKGGVGKSVITATLALRARALGMRPVVFECDAPPRQRSLLPAGKLPSAELGIVAPSILGINQRSEDAIRDYAAQTLPSRTVVDLLFENRVAQTFLQAAPSVREMALMGRIAAVADECGSDGPVLVDLHATGHALALLRAPGGIRQVLRRGPLADRATAIERMLLDDKRCAFVCVTVPEELPVTESSELLDALRSLRAPLGPVVVNSLLLPPAPLPKLTVGPEDPAALAIHDHQLLSSWSARNAREHARLSAVAAKHGLHVASFPHLAPRGDDVTLAEQLVTSWQKVSS